MQAVTLRLAYSWLCPHCGAVKAEPIPDPRLYEPPASVECERCEIQFTAETVRPVAQRKKMIGTHRTKQ